MVGEISQILLATETASILVLSYVSYRMSFLTPGGLAALVAVLLISTVTLGPAALGLMLFVFLSSSLLERYHPVKGFLTGDFPKETGRNAWRIIGGAGPATAVAVLSPWEPHTSVLVRMPFVAALAATASDTWASEVGILSKRRPRLILPPWSQVEHGRSGAVSPLGEVFSLAGALATVMVALGLGLFELSVVTSVQSFLIAVFAEHLDSLLGASLQAVYRCPACRVECEAKLHSCGTKTVLVRGHSWMTNEMVNFISGCTAVVVAFSVQTL